MKSPEQITSLYTSRVKDQQQAHSAIQLFRDYITDKIPVPLPELDRNELSAIANIAAQGLEQMALRVGSTLPTPYYPPLKPGIKVSEDKARNRQRANLGWWEHANMQEVLTLRAEYLFADGLAPVTVLPDPATGVPTWRVRDPLSYFPAPHHDPLAIVPSDAILTYQQSYVALLDIWGSVVAQLRRHRDATPDTMFTVLEYMDRHEIVTLVIPQKDAPGAYNMTGINAPLELARIPNKAGVPLAFGPGITTIVGRRGKFNGTIGAHQMRAKLLALAYITARAGAIPEPWIEPLDNSSAPDVLATPDMRAGTPGVIKGGRMVWNTPNPGFMTSPMLSILEREMRLSGGIPAEFGGEAASTVRTARRGAQLVETTVDFPIQRAQNVLARSLEHEDKAAIAIAKHWTPGKRSFYVSWKGATGWADYDPAEDFETDMHNVRYSLAGSDLNSEIVRSAQKVGTGLWSKRTARENDPETYDAEGEGDRVQAEQLDEAFWTSVMQKVADPASRWGPGEIAKIAMLIRSNKMDQYEAVAQIEAEMAETVEAPADALPGAPGVEMPVDPGAPIPPVAEGLANLAGNLRANYVVNAAAAA